MEKTIEIKTTDNIMIEAKIQPGKGGQSAILCHPHSLYGGTMNNNVVLAARDAALRLGLGTLRFNFRGVGASGGAFDEGKGEQRDLEACFTSLESHEQGRDGVHLVAYSFGSWVAVQALGKEMISPVTVTLISPPVDFLDFSGLELSSQPTLVVSGDQDQYGSVDSVDDWLADQPSGIGTVGRVILSGADHFYSGKERELDAAITRYLGLQL